MNKMKIQGHLTDHACSFHLPINFFFPSCFPSFLPCFFPLLQEQTKIRIVLSTDDITVAICPGIGNTSESVYIRTFVHYAQCHGYRTAVLNHIGALASVQVTSYRIFTYGMLLIKLHTCVLKKHNYLRSHWRL